MESFSRRRYAIPESRVRTLNRMFYPKITDISATDKETSIRKLIETGFVRPGSLIKSGVNKSQRLLRLTAAGKIRLRALKYARMGSFSNLSSVHRLRFTSAFLVDLIHELRVAAFEEKIRNWVHRPIAKRKKNPYTFFPVILADEVEMVLERMRESAKHRIAREGIARKTRIDDFPGPILGEIRESRSRDALVKYALDNWQSPGYRRAIYARTGKIWPETVVLLRMIGLHQRWEKKG